MNFPTCRVCMCCCCTCMCKSQPCGVCSKL